MKDAASLLWLLCLLLTRASSECQTSGINCQSNKFRVCTSAYIKWEDSSDEYVLYLFGSFVAKSTCDQTFRINSDSTSFLSDAPKANFVFDGDSRGMQEGTWDYPASLVKDWRYSYSTQTDSKHYYCELELSLRIPGGSSFSLLTSADSDLCTDSGCKDLSHYRGYSCLPSPSVSPIATASRPFVPSSAVRHSVLLAPSSRSYPSVPLPISHAISASNGFRLSSPIASPRRPFRDPVRIRPRMIALLPALFCRMF
jgi:hypothetical protein